MDDTTDAAATSRRAVLRAGAAALGATVGLSGLANAAAAPFEEQPSYVTLRGYGEVPDLLERYRPVLDVSRLQDPPEPSFLAAWYAESTEADTDVACYWAWYPFQEGIGDADSHVPDREPVYCFVDSETGELERVIFDRLHYGVGISTTPPTVGDTQPTLQVISRWHPYATTTSATTAVGLADMTDYYGRWLDNDWGVDREAVVNPWSIQRKGDWWPDTFGGRMEAAKLRVAQYFADDVQGAEDIIYGWF
jgi:hypothetical protein